MATIRLQVKTIRNLGLWDKVCEYKGWNNWILNEGRVSDDEYVEFDDHFQNESERHINQMMINGTVSMEIGDSPQDFEELFQKFIDEFNWKWTGKIEMKD